MKYKLYHYSSIPLVLSTNHHYKNTLSFKPNGLWLSVNDEWEKWCVDQNMFMDSLLYKTEIFIKDYSNVRFIRTQKDIDEIENEFGMFIPSFSFFSCDWEKMKNKYDGIFIDEENDDLIRAGFKNYGLSDWIEAWDCLSGCIWNFNIIQIGKKFKLK